MNRIFAAAALAAVMVPAVEAVAATTAATTFGKTYQLQCQVNANDGAALKVRIMVKNTTGHVIKQGTPIQLRTVVGHRRYMITQLAYRDVAVNDSIGLDQRPGARACSAQVRLLPDTQTKIKTR